MRGKRGEEETRRDGLVRGLRPGGAEVTDGGCGRRRSALVREQLAGTTRNGAPTRGRQRWSGVKRMREAKDGGRETACAEGGEERRVIGRKRDEQKNSRPFPSPGRGGRKEGGDPRDEQAWKSVEKQKGENKRRKENECEVEMVAGNGLRGGKKRRDKKKGQARGLGSETRRAPRCVS